MILVLEGSSAVPAGQRHSHTDLTELKDLRGENGDRISDAEARELVEAFTTLMSLNFNNSMWEGAVKATGLALAVNSMLTNLNPSLVLIMGH